MIENSDANGRENICSKILTSERLLIFSLLKLERPGR